ncbi:MAG: flagellar motor protein MotB [Alphaproteobacteria bacterium]|nr:flagellar motor protein MotB [Alphaproteobacteria bacterium]
MSSNKPVVIKKIKKVIGGGHHGGAWKVAYADFVTAMMAFFLLMWLINTTSPEQKRGIADYFAPASVSRSTQGSDGLLGGTAFDQDGARSSGSNRPIAETQSAESRRRSQRGGGDGDGQSSQGGASKEALARALARRSEGAEFQSAETSLRQAMQDMPDFAELSKHLIIDQTPEGLRIQLIDQEGRAMFAGSSAEPLPRTQHLLEAVAKVIEKLPNRISISGHTDTSAPARTDYSNWELSADRANAARRILEAHGVDSDRIFQVTGKAASEPLYPDDPDLPANRRISIVLLREAPVLPVDHSL